MDGVPTRDEMLGRLQGLVHDKIGIDPALLRPEARLADIGIDSFSLIELVFLAEEEFKISIPTEGLVVNTVDDVLGVIEKRIGEERD